MKILLAELRTQDPLKPLENGQLLEQINAMQSLTANQKLISALDSITLSQNLGSASSLIGKTIAGTTAAGAAITGSVEKAVVEDGRVFLMIGGERLSIENVSEIS